MLNLQVAPVVTLHFCLSLPISDQFLLVSNSLLATQFHRGATEFPFCSKYFTNKWQL
jgi:hypothetical protein